MIHARFATDDTGKAALALVGAGHFVFRATQPDGRSGEAALEVEPGAELDTLVITVKQ